MSRQLDEHSVSFEPTDAKLPTATSRDRKEHPIATPALSIVVPVYNSDECLRELYHRLTAVLGQLNVPSEIIFVDDGSADGSWKTIRDLALGDARIKALRLSRNFGQHAAITAGLGHTAGRSAIVMDSDLQDPPEEIPRLFALATSGMDIVYARRMGRQHSGIRIWAARVYFALLGRLNRVSFDHRYGSFSMISRKTIDAFLEIRDRHRHYLLILGWLGFPSATIDYQHAPRFGGRSSYSLSRLLQHAVDGVFFQTTILLKWIVYSGFVLSLVGFLGILGIVILHFTRSMQPGWPSLAALILLVGGFIIISTGVVGLYIGKIFEQVKDRPLFVVSQKIVGGLEQR